MQRIFLMILSTIMFVNASGYISIEVEHLKGEKVNILGIQPTSELVDINPAIAKVKLGLSVSNPKSFLVGSQVGLYGAFGNNKWKSYEGGISFSLKNKRFGLGVIHPYFDGHLGVGFSDNKNQKVQTTTSVNKLNFIKTRNLNDLKQTDKAIFSDNNTWLGYGFGVGLEITVGHLNIKGGYIYHKREYQIKYRLKSSQDVLNNITFTQPYGGFAISFLYTF